MHTLLQDVRYALRQMRKSPGFAITAVLTLALGIGATTAIFTLIHAVLLKSLPVADPAQLWRVGDYENCCHDSGIPDSGNGKVNDWALFSYEQYREFKANTPGFENLAAFASTNDQVAVRRAGSRLPAEPFFVEFVSGNAFDILGVRAYAGRMLHPSDDVKGAPPVAVLSYDAWTERFGGNAAIVGSSVVVDGQPMTVVGIGPPGFYGDRLSPNPASFWFPLNTLPLLLPEAGYMDHTELDWLNLIGRVKPGTSMGGLQARLNVELQQFLRSPLSKLTAQEQELIPKQYLRLAPGGGGVQQMQDQYKGDLRLLMWIASFVLLIACANLANLMLARSVTQRQQLSVRTALGATRRRLVKHALIESLLLALIGGSAGLAVAWSGAKLILYLQFRNTPVNISSSPSWPVLGFAMAVSLLTGLLFGIAPAWMAAHADPVEALRGANRSTGRQTLWAQKALVVAQSAVSVVLLCASGFLILSLNRMHHRDLGIETANRYILRIDPQQAGYQPNQLDSFYRQLQDTLGAIPGVEQVAYSLYTPFDGDSWGESVAIEGEPPGAPDSPTSANWVRVSPNYFKTIGTKLVEGRGFSDSDNATSMNVAIVNEAFVRKLLHGKSPIGTHFGDWGPTMTHTFDIVGVVGDTQYQDPSRPARPMYFLPEAQSPQLPPSAPRAADYAHFVSESHYLGSVEIETRGTVPQLEIQVRRALAQVNPNLPVIQFQTFAKQVDLAFSQESMVAQLTSLFGFLALVLAAIGLYGVTAYSVAQRTGEIGLRMALGADRANVLRMVVRGAVWQVAIGLLIGIPSAILTGHLMAAQLYSTTPYSPAVLGATVLVLGLSALVASAVPARRAASVEPMQALRNE